MARNEQQPVSDEEIEAAREAIREQKEEIRADLAEAGVDVSSWDSDDEADSEASPDRDTADSD
jgi:GH25 family lysozyme M1 (1,4-beta-N-acetylmuramidase)